MSSLVDLTKYKNKAIEYTIKDTDIVNAIKGNRNIDDPSDLIWEVVYPYLHIDPTQEQTDCFLMFEVNVPESYRNSMATVIKDMELTITILCHRNLMKFSEGTRLDYISGRIDQLFNKNSNFSGGRLMLKSNNAYVLSGGVYHYRTIIYTTIDKNQASC